MPKNRSWRRRGKERILSCKTVVRVDGAADPRLFGEPNRAMEKLRWWRTWVKEPRHMMAENLCIISALYFVLLGSGESH